MDEKLKSRDMKGLYIVIRKQIQKGRQAPILYKHKLGNLLGRCCDERMEEIFRRIIKQT